MAGARQRALEAMGGFARGQGLVGGTGPGAASYVGTFAGWDLRIEDDVERNEVDVWFTVPSPPAQPLDAPAAALYSDLRRLESSSGAGLILQADPELFDRSAALGAAFQGGGSGGISIHPNEVHGTLSYRACDEVNLAELVGLCRAAGDLYWSLPAAPRTSVTPVPRSNVGLVAVLLVTIAVVLVAAAIAFAVLV